MKDFINDHWRPILAFNGLDGFDALWRLEAEWFEPPNERRGGWSGVARYELHLPGGGTRAIFLKRQENHQTRTLAHPLRGVPTFLREFKRIMAYRAGAIPTLDPVYFAMRRCGQDHRAILATEELAGFMALGDWELSNMRDSTRRERLGILQAVAELLRKMHSRGIRHGCFYPKHVFIRACAEGSVEARVIDLEKSRRRPHVMCRLRDLHSLAYYSSPAWSLADRLRFFRHYLGISRMNAYAKWLWRSVVISSTRKRARRDG